MEGGAPRSARQRTPTSSPEEPARRTTVQAVHAKLEARAVPRISPAGAKVTSVGYFGRAARSASLKRRGSCLSLIWEALIWEALTWEALTSEAPQIRTVSSSDVWKRLRPTDRPPNRLAARSAKLRVNSGRCRTLLSSRVIATRASARRRGY